MTASDQPSPSVPGSADPETAIDGVLRILLHRLFFLVATLGSVTMVAATVRATQEGYTPSYAVDVLAFAVVFVALALRERLRVRVVFGAVVGAFVVMGLASLATLGLASAGLPILTAACALVGVFASLRVGIYLVVTVALVAGLIGLGHVYSVFAPLPDVAAFIGAPSTWATQTSSFIAFALTVVVAAASVRRRLTRSLEELGQRGAELARVAAQLRESEQRHRLLAENMTDVVFVQALDMSVVYLSKSAEPLLGRDVEELRRLGMHEVMTPESLLRARELYARLLPRAQAGEEVEPPLMEFEYVRADGSTFWGELKVKFLRDANGGVVGSQGVLRDISERRRAEQQRLALEERLREVDKLQAIGQLAGGVAHDFNNQLSAIMGFAELIGLSQGASTEARAHAGSILQAARRSADLTSKLLAFARRTQQRAVAVDVHAVVGEVVAMLDRTVEKHIRIETRLHAPRSVVLGDPTQLASALLNLGLNARDAMPDGGSLVFATEVSEGADGSCLELRVSDTGIGMDAETVSHAFEPFFTRKELGKGTGLGLAAVYGTVHSHGGTIDIESSPGSGSTFRVRLPLHDASPQGLGIAMAGVPALAPRRATVLVVDDEELVGRATALALERAGHRVHLFQSPTAALAFHRERAAEIELAVIDMIMPELSGQEVFTELRARSPDLAVLLISGHIPAATVERLLGMGARGFLAKPFTPSEIIAAAERALDPAPAQPA